MRDLAFDTAVKNPSGNCRRVGGTVRPNAFAV
jgi:hypothetical protein